MNKRGISSIIAILLIVLLVIIAIGIVWFMIKGVLVQGTEGIGFEQFTIDLDIKKASISIEESNAEVTVKRNKGKGDLQGLKIIIDDGENTEVFERNTTLSELGIETFTLTLNESNASAVEKISIVPILKLDSGKEKTGNIIDEYTVTENDKTCTSTCSSLGYECNTQTICGEEVNCGSCNDMHTCNNGICVLKTSDMISWWKLDGNAIDNLGNNNGTINGANCGVDGKYNWSCSFDSDNIQIDNSDFSSLGTSFSVAAWAKPSSWDEAYNTIIGQESGFLLAINSSGNLANWLNTGLWTKDESSNPPISLNTWTYFVMTYNGSIFKSYINGEPVSTGQSLTGDMSSASDVYIGMRDPGGTIQPFHGSIDEVMIFNKSLSETEVQLLYESDFT